jgi:hypothetical protein
MNDKIFVRTSKSRDSRENIGNSSGTAVPMANPNGLTNGNGILVKRPERKDNFKKKEAKPNLNTLEGLHA